MKDLGRETLDEMNRLLLNQKQLKMKLEKMGNYGESATIKNQIADLSKKVEHLQEQLNEKGLWIGALKTHLEECWEIIKLYAEHDYLTPEDFYMRDRLERYYRKAGLANIEDAKKLLEKWGVK